MQCAIGCISLYIYIRKCLGSYIPTLLFKLYVCVLCMYTAYYIVEHMQINAFGRCNCIAYAHLKYIVDYIGRDT